MESSPYDEAYNIDDDEEPSQVDMYTPSPRNPKQNTRQEKGSKQSCKIDLKKCDFKNKLCCEIATAKKNNCCVINTIFKSCEIVTQNL